MTPSRPEKLINISPEETQGRLLASLILEYNDDSLWLARDDRENLITFGDEQGNKSGIPFPEGERDLWKQMRVFRNLFIHGMIRFLGDGSVTIFPSELWKNRKYDADVQPFPDGLGLQVDGVYKYSLADMRALGGSFSWDVA